MRIDEVLWSLRDSALAEAISKALEKNFLNMVWLVVVVGFLIYNLIRFGLV